MSNNHRVFFAFPITQWVIAWMSENEIYKLCLNGKRSVNHQYRQNDIEEETKRDASLRCMMTIRRLTAEAIYICWFDALFPCSLWIRQTDRPKSKQLGSKPQLDHQTKTIYIHSISFGWQMAKAKRHSMPLFSEWRLAEWGRTPPTNKSILCGAFVLYIATH